MLLGVDLVVLLGLINWCVATLLAWFKDPETGNRFKSHDDCVVLTLAREPSRLSDSPVLVGNPARISVQHVLRV